ncbi:MAG: hypothetical protein ACXVYW_09345 [Oryzihumus sp.]
MSDPCGASYEVVVPGELGPAFLAAFLHWGVAAVRTSSVFLLPVPQGQGVPDVAAMLQARGLLILGIRRVADPAPHRGERQR